MLKAKEEKAENKFEATLLPTFFFQQFKEPVNSRF